MYFLILLYSFQKDVKLFFLYYKDLFEAPEWSHNYLMNDLVQQ